MKHQGISLLVDVHVATVIWVIDLQRAINILTSLNEMSVKQSNNSTCLMSGLRLKCHLVEKHLTYLLVFMMCIGSLIFHREWLNDNILTENFLRCLPFWLEAPPFSDHVMTCFSWNRTVETLEITGLSDDILYMAKVESLKLEYQISKMPYCVTMNDFH